MTMNIQNVLLMARLSAISYEADEAKSHSAVERLGLCWRGLVGNAGCQALIAEDDAGSILVFRGTPGVHLLSDARELWDDADIFPHRTPYGDVAAGPWGDMKALEPQISPLLRGRVRATGHSLGGGRAHLSRVLWPQISAVISFGAPPVGSADVWGDLYRNTPLTRVVHGRDPIPDAGWPVWCHPGPMLWLNGKGAMTTASRLGLNDRLPDHDIAAYVAALETLQ